MADNNEFPDLPCLEELILDGNPIAGDNTLNNLAHLKCLKSLSMNGCAYCEEKAGDLNKEVIIAFIDRINGF